MNKTVVISVAIFVVGAVVSVVFHAQATRYVTVNAGEGRVYRVDRRTGESVLLEGVQAIPVENSRPPQAQDPNEEAIRLAKDAQTLDSSYSSGDNEYQIRSWLRGQKGELSVLGWDARRVDDQTYVVTYAITQGARSRSWRFEVNVEAQIVRNINGDMDLEKMYGRTLQIVRP